MADYHGPRCRFGIRHPGFQERLRVHLCSSVPIWQTALLVLAKGVVLVASNKSTRAFLGGLSFIFFYFFCNRLVYTKKKCRSVFHPICVRPTWAQWTHLYRWVGTWTTAITRCVTRIIIITFINLIPLMGVLGQVRQVIWQVERGCSVRCR